MAEPMMPIPKYPMCAFCISAYTTTGAASLQVSDAGLTRGTCTDQGLRSFEEGLRLICSLNRDERTHESNARIFPSKLPLT